MQKLFYSLLIVALLFNSMNAQPSFGIGTDTPNSNAILDVFSTDRGVLIPRLTNAQRTAISGLGTTEEGLLIYNTTDSEFNYWNGSIWISFPAAGTDDDWHEESLTTAPNDINDDIFTMGNVGIGKNTADHPLDIETSLETALNIAGDYSGTTTNHLVNLDRNLTTYNLSSHQQSSILNMEVNGNLPNTAIGYNHTMYGTRRNFNVSGAGYINDVMMEHNLLIGSFSSTSNQIYGNYSNIRPNYTGTGHGFTFGAYLSLGSSGNGSETGIRTDVRGTADGWKTGIQNYVNGDPDQSAYTGDIYYYGVYNTVQSSGDDRGGVYGTYNQVNRYAAGKAYGTYNKVYNTYQGNAYGNYTQVYGNNGTNYGDYIYMSQFSTGDTVYAIYDSIASHASNTNPKYGIFSAVDDLTYGYAGFFRGRVAIGTNRTNHYIMPQSRGLNGQIMQTDGAGNVSWVSASSSDADWFTENTTSSPTSINNNIYTNGRVGIGTSTPYVAASLNILPANLNYGILIDHDRAVPTTGYGLYIDLDHTLGSSLDADNYGIYSSILKDGPSNSYLYGNFTFANDYQTGTSNRYCYGVYGYAYSAYTPGVSRACGIFGTVGGMADVAYAGYFNGDVYSAGTYNTSDKKLKQNISPYHGALEKIGKLNPVKFNYKNEQYPLINLPKGEQIGLIAQEVKQVFPNMVKRADIGPQKIPLEQAIELGLSYTKTDEEGIVEVNSNEDILAVNYTNLVPVLIKAMQEQQEKIEKLEQEIELLKK